MMQYSFDWSVGTDVDQPMWRQQLKFLLSLAVPLLARYCTSYCSENLLHRAKPARTRPTEKLASASQTRNCFVCSAFFGLGAAARTAEQPATRPAHNGLIIKLFVGADFQLLDLSMYKCLYNYVVEWERSERLDLGLAFL